MGQRPFNPWQQRTEPEGPLAEDEEPEDDFTQFRPYAHLYRALLAVMSPSQVDDCELWQIATLLRVDEKSDDDLGPSPTDLDERRRRESHTLATRVARRRGQRDDT